MVKEPKGRQGHAEGHCQGRARKRVRRHSLASGYYFEVFAHQRKSYLSVSFPQLSCFLLNPTTTQMHLIAY